MAENLSGLPPIFNQLNLLRDEQGKPVFRTDVTPLSEVMAQIEARANYGEQATGKFLEDEFAKVPFGWDFEAIRLFTLCLLRAGRIEAVSKGQTIEAATSVQAKECFSNNNLFRAANFRPKKGIDFAVIAEAAEHFKDTFGNEVREFTANAVAIQLRKEIERHEEELEQMLVTIRTARLPGSDVIENAVSQMRSIRRGSEENAIATFNAGHKSIKDAIQRGADLGRVLTEPALRDIERARAALAKLPVLLEEPDLDPAIAARGHQLKDLLDKETFFRELAAIDQSALTLATEFKRRFGAALDVRVATYLTALEALAKTPGWERLDDAQRDEVARPLRQGVERNADSQTLRHLRSETEACAGRLASAIEKVHQMLEGERLATISITQFFSGGIETEEQLEQALAGLRDEFSRLLGEGKKVIVR
jgi:hypothetical protein